MITEREGSIFEQDDLTHIAHQANLYHTFGAGIAAEIKRRYPYAFQADKATNCGDEEKLGTFSAGMPPTGGGPAPVVVNLYSQRGLGARVSTDYVAMRRAMYLLRDWLELLKRPVVLGLPHGIGCGLARGDWKRVAPIIGDVWGNRTNIRTVVCRLPVAAGRR